jgi:hypothetical protein
MSKIVLAGKYAQVSKLTVHAKNWAVRPKKPMLERDRVLKGGHVTVKRGHSYLTDKVSTVTYDNPEEMLKGMHKETDKQLEKFRYPGQEAFKNYEKQTGRGMWSNELVGRILKANPYLFVEDSINAPGCAGFYKMVGGVKVAAGKPNASFRHGWMPECTLKKMDKADLMVEFVFGWRQVLIRLRRSFDLSATSFQKLYGVMDYSDERGQHLASDLGDFKVA